MTAVNDMRHRAQYTSANVRRALSDGHLTSTLHQNDGQLLVALNDEHQELKDTGKQAADDVKAGQTKGIA